MEGCYLWMIRLLRFEIIIVGTGSILISALCLNGVWLQIGFASLRLKYQHYGCAEGATFET